MNSYNDLFAELDQLGAELEEQSEKEVHLLLDLFLFLNQLYWT